MLRKRHLSILILILACQCTSTSTERDTSQAGPSSGASYYVSPSGNDDNHGTSPEEAWETIDRANALACRPGDSILFKRGDTWDEELHPVGEGTAADPIVIGSYVKGPRPAIDRQIATGNNIDKVCIRSKNIAGYRIKGIEFARLGRGVFVDFDKGGGR